MKINNVKKGLLFIALVSALSVNIFGKEPLMIKEQGSFAAGGVVLKNSGVFDSTKADDSTPFKLYPSEGQTFHGDHAYVFYQKPVDMKKYPLVFLHGGGQSGKSWETTPDGREGFQNIFLRKKYGVYIVDQPRRGRAGQGIVPMQINPSNSDQYLYNFFRIGLYPKFFDGVQFPKDEESFNQYYRQVTPNTGAFDEEIVAKAMSAVFDKTGEGILVAHSQGGGAAMSTAMKNKNVKALVLYEPGGCSLFFPEGTEIGIPKEELPDYFSVNKISKKEFKKLTEIPIVIYFGDNIPSEKSEYPILEEWRLRLNLARKWAEIVNANGGDAKIVHLPEIGVKGNTHFPFSDLNNEEIADLMEKWMEEKGLNK